MNDAIKSLPRVYLAGPEVFMPEAVAIGAHKCALAEQYGFQGVFPLDNALDLDGLDKHEQAARIWSANEDLMRGCDGLIANLTPFRGVSMDSGTAFEVGFMRALGRPVIGYTTVEDYYASRSRLYRQSEHVLAFDGDCPDYEVEDFALAENLMISCAISSYGFDVAIDTTDGASLANMRAFEDCLKSFRSWFAGLRGSHQHG